MTDPGLDAILAYLREHSGRYSLAALRQQLLQGGYDPAAVDSAIQIFQGTNPPKTGERVWPRAWRVVLINALLMGAATALAAASAVPDDVKAAAGFTIVVILCGEFVAGLGLALTEKRRTLGGALLLGFLLSTALGILILSGVCIYSLSHTSFH